MKNPMSNKGLGTVVAALRKLGHRAWHKVQTRHAGAFRLRMSHNALTIVIPEGIGEGVSGAISGGVYRVPRTRRFAVERRDRVLSFQLDEGEKHVHVPFGSVQDATIALDRIAQRLLSRRPLVWATRLLALGVCWLLVSSYLQVRSKQAAQAQEMAIAGQPAGGPLAALPDVNAPFQALPAAPAPAIPVAPPQDVPGAGVPAPAAAPSGGLSGFGLDLEGSGAPPASTMPAPEAGSTPGGPLVTAGPGCDPSLAFKAPAR